MISVAIDGPSGAGKSTIARLVSEELGFIYVDTGAMYRTIGLYVLSKGMDTTNESQVTSILGEINIKIEFTKIDGQRIFLNGEDVSEKIRQPEMSMAASNVSAIKSVRAFLFNLQRDSAKKDNVIMDGRDIGTVVLPNADVKIFLTATPSQRAKRRLKDFIDKGIKIEFNEVLKDIEKRDYNDSHREIAPLKQADDAIVVDTTNLTLEQTKEKIINIVKEKI